MWDISPGNMGSDGSFATDVADFEEYYDFFEAAVSTRVTPSIPTPGPYEPQMVPRGDYTRCLAEFWADGPDSETPQATGSPS